MKTSTSSEHLCSAALTAVFLFFSAFVAKSDTNYINRFDVASEVDSWAFEFGSVTHTNSFDPTMDGNTNASSGSMKVTFGFDSALGGENKGAYNLALSLPIASNDVPNLDGIHLDIKVDPASTNDAYGLNGYFGLVFRMGPTWAWTPQIGDNIGTNYPAGQVDENGWRHIDQSIVVPQDYDTIHHVTFQLYGGPGQNITGPVTFWIDNLYYTTFTVTTSAPPLMTIDRTVAGCNITASVVGDPFQRQDIRTADALGNYLWINSSNGPVTYSFTVTNFPSSPTNGFETHMLLVGNHFAPGPFADYNETNVVYLRLYDVGGHYDEELYYKVNSDHSTIFTNFLGRISSPTPLGTWGITLSGTNVTMFGPAGTLNTNMGPEVLTAFNTYTYPYLGINPARVENVGLSATFSAAAVSGAVPTPLDEHFNNLNKWKKNGLTQDPTGVLVQPSNTFAKISWPFPQSPIYSVHSTNVVRGAAAPEGSWPPSGLTINTVGTNKVVLLSTPTNSSRFFRLETP